MSLQRFGRTAVALVGDDPAEGRALALVLESAGFSSRFVASAASDDQGAGLEGTDLILLTPGTSAKRRRALLRTIRGAAGGQGIPVVELGLTPAGGEVARRLAVPWPCRAEDLSRAVRAALTTWHCAGSGAVGEAEGR